MEKVHSETDAKGIRYDLYIQQDNQDVRGNASACGDDAEDKAAEDEILARLDNGDVWAWACVKVTASYKGITGDDYLGGCCYTDTSDFIAPGGYYDDMKGAAREAMITEARNACAALKELN